MGNPGWPVSLCTRGAHVHGMAGSVPHQMPNGPTALLVSVKMGKMHRKSPAALGR